MTKYPAELDDDSSLPTVVDGSAENSAEALSALRDAVLAIEREIGANPAGSVATLVQRLAVAINDDGTLKSSALLAAGLISLPITNSQISASAAIAESKLDLDIATQVLQDQVTSNDIDIGALQDAVLELLNRFVDHVGGNDYFHDGYQILLDSDYPDSTPPWLAGFDAHTVSQFIASISASYDAHLNGADAHTAEQITLGSGTGLSAENLQEAVGELAGLRASEISRHLDNNHSNGISAWSNDPTGYDAGNLKISQVTASVIGSRILDLGVSVAGVGVGDVVVSDANTWQIAAVGPAPAVGALPALASDQVLVFGELGGASTMQVRVFGAASIPNLRTPLACALIDGAGTSVDSLALVPPNSARVVSLGLDARFVDSSSSVSVSVDTASGTRSITVANLDLDRSGVATDPTIISVCDRLNIAFQSVGFPAMAAVIGDELTISCTQQETYSSLLISSASKFLGFDSVVGTTVPPTVACNYIVGGTQYTEFPLIVAGDGSIVGGSVPIPSTANYGITVGHRLHILDSNVPSTEGTYRISAVGPNSVTISPAPADCTATFHILADTVAMSDFSGQTGVVQCFVGADGRPHASMRATTTDSIAGVRLIGISDGFAPGSLTIQSAASGADRTLSISGAVSSVTVRSTLSGTIRVYGITNVDWLDLALDGAVGAGSMPATINSAVSEEENLELALVRFDGTRTQQISDRRLFGNLGLDELREDVVQAHVEAPLAELRANGAVRGFGLTSSTGIDGSAPGFDYPAGTQLLLVDGGTAYVGGARVSQNTQYVAIPPVDGYYTVVLRPTGYLSVVPDTKYTASELIEGLGGDALVVATVHRTSGPVAISATSLVRYITRLDDRVDQIIDLTNSFIGNFSSVEAAIAHANAAPDGELTRFNLVSTTSGPVQISDLSANVRLAISGAVGALAIDSELDLWSSPDVNRTTPHASSVQIGGTAPVNRASFTGLILGSVGIDATATTAAKYVFRDCVFADGCNFTVTGTNVESLDFIGCSSVGTLNISIGITGSVSFTDCKFVCDGGTVVCSANDMKMSRVEMDNGVLQLGATGTYTITNLVQKNTVAATILSGDGQVWLDQYECISASATNPQLVVLPDATIDGAIFSDIAITGVSAGAALVEALHIKNLHVQDISTTVPTPLAFASTAEQCRFVDCQYSEIRASELIRAAVGLNCARKIDLASTTRLVIDQCDLVMSADASPSIQISDGYQIVRECSFDFGTNLVSGQLAIQFTAENTVDVGIFDNSFFGANVDGDGPYGGGYGIDFLNLQNNNLIGTPEISGLHRVVVDRCDFRGIQSIKANSAPLSGLLISNCKSEGLFDIQVANNFDMIGNEVSALVLRGNTGDANVISNKFKIYAWLQGVHSRMTFESNTGTLYLDAMLSSCRFSGFSGSVISYPGSSAQDCSFTDMNLDDTSDFSELSLTRTRITGSSFAGYQEFNISSGGSVEACRFAADVRVGGTPIAFSFVGNSSLATPGSQLNFAAGVQACRVESNLGFSMVFEDGISESTVSGNTRLDGYLEFLGSLLTTSAITSNYFSEISVMTGAATLSLVGQNVLSGDLVFAQGLNAATYDDLSLVSNRVGGAIDFARGASALGGVVTISNVVMDNNVSGSVRFAEQLGSGAPSIQFSDILISSASVSTMSFGAEDTTPDFDGANVSYDGIIVSSSSIIDMSIRGARPNASTATAVSCERFVFSSCDFTRVFIGRESDLYTDPMSHVNLTDFAFVGCRSGTAVDVFAVKIDGLTFTDFISPEVNLYVIDGSTSVGGSVISSPDVIGLAFTGCEIDSITVATTTASAVPTTRTVWIVDTKVLNSNIATINMPGSLNDGTRNIKGLNVSGCRFKTATAAGIFIEHKQSFTYLTNLIVANCLSDRNTAYALSYVPAAAGTGTAELEDASVLGCQYLSIDVDLRSLTSEIRNLSIASSSLYDAYISADLIFNASASSNFLTGGSPGLITFDGGTINSLLLSANIFGDVHLTGPVASGVVAQGNRFAVFELSGLGNAANSINYLALNGNVCTDIVLPPITRHQDGEEQTKIIGNSLSGAFSCASAFTISSKAGAVFAWGNTSASAVNVTFDGTTATNTNTANNLAGAGITP